MVFMFRDLGYLKIMVVDLTYTSSCSAFPSSSCTSCAMTMFARTFAGFVYPLAKRHWYIITCFIYQDVPYNHDLCPSDVGRRLGYFLSNPSHSLSATWVGAILDCASFLFFQDFSSLRYPYFGEISPLLFSLVHWESIVFFQDFSNPVAT